MWQTVNFCCSYSNKASSCLVLMAVIFLLIMNTVDSQSGERHFSSAFRQKTGPTERTWTDQLPIHSTLMANRPLTVCEGYCCRCNIDQTLIECQSSSNCKILELGQQNRLPKSARVVKIIDFRQLKLYRNCLEQLYELKQISIENVERIETESFALSQPLCGTKRPLPGGRLPSLPTISINHSSIINLTQRTFTGAWDEISITNSKLERTETDSFYQLNCLKKLTIETSVITDMETRTLRDGVTQYLTITSNKIRCIKNNAFNLNVTDTAIITSNQILDIQSEAFSLKSPQMFRFYNNTVGIVYSHAFKLEASKKIDFNSSFFGKIARHAFHQMRTMDGTKIIFGLSVKKFDKGALDLDKSLSVSAMQTVDIKFDLDCECDMKTRVDFLFSDTAVVDLRVDDELMKNLLKDSVSCNIQNRTEKVEVFLRSHHCHLLSSPNIVVTIVVVCGLLVLILLGLGIAVAVTMRKRTKISRKHGESQKAFVMRVYTETECKVEEEYTVPIETHCEF